MRYFNVVLCNAKTTVVMWCYNNTLKLKNYATARES
jgi:hypothetical protein